MPSPFPGMDPYLELPSGWPSVHFSLIAELQRALRPLVRPRYFVLVEERLFSVPASELVGLELVGGGDVLVTKHRKREIEPNGRGGAMASAAASSQSQEPAVLTVQLPYTVEVREHYLELRTADTREVVTDIEVLSPTNKRAGDGRRQYEAKRAAIAASATSLVEIDLLRGGGVLPVWLGTQSLPADVAGDYRVVVARGYERPRATLYTSSVRDRLPVIPIPLRPGEDEPQVDLQQIVDTLYDDGEYERLIEYRGEPVPPLKPEDAAWADGLLRASGKR
jgi:Protein of unknown function (DUF4058)